MTVRLGKKMDVKDTSGHSSDDTEIRDRKYRLKYCRFKQGM